MRAEGLGHKVEVLCISVANVTEAGENKERVKICVRGGDGSGVGGRWWWGISGMRCRYGR